MASTVPTTFRGFPKEIWLLIVEEAARSNATSTLLLLARLSHGMACFALPLMYSIPYDHDILSRLHEFSRADNRSVCFWRSIILSSLGRTLHPYCCWIDTLDLHDLLEILKQIDKSKDAELRERFYSPPLSYLQLLRTDTPNHIDLEGGFRPHVLFCELVNKITEGIKTAMDQGHITSHLANFFCPELDYFPSTIYFPLWISRLSGLRSFHIHDASLLDEKLAITIAQNCPALKRFICFMTPSEEAEKRLSNLLQTLPPNTMESFTVIRGAIRGPDLLKGLGRHAGSLRRLSLTGLGTRALGALNELRDCNALESLDLHASGAGPDLDFARSNPAVYGQCVEWLQNCTQMTHLGLSVFIGSTQLLKDSLPGPKLRLKSLTLVLVESNAPWYDELHHQANLEYLSIEVPQLEFQELGPASGRCQGLATGIARCPKLRELEAEERFSVADMAKISEGALALEKISFSGTLVHDAHIMPLASLPRLKEIYVTGDSAFTATGILSFFEKMQENPDHDHQGFEFGAAFQQGTAIGPKENKRIRKAAKRAFGGSVDIQFIDSDGEDYYFRDD